MSQDKTTLIYIGDPMCSWCYGFAPEISSVKEHFNTFDFKIITGGLRANGTETMKELGSFLADHWKDVESSSKQPFNYDILKDTTFIYNTEPSCRATLVSRKMNPKLELTFFKAIQTAFYAENKNTNETITFIEIAENLGLDGKEFKTLFESQELISETKEDFELASQLGVRGFPAVLISQNGKIKQVCNGYMKADKLIKNINANLTEKHP